MSGNRWFPNTTQVPNHFLDFIAPGLNQSELKVALYILRRTYGFQKEWDRIALSQLVEGITRGDGTPLDKGTGLSKTSVLAGIRGLEAKGLITAHRTPRSGKQAAETTFYRLNATLLDGDAGGSQDSAPPPTEPSTAPLPPPSTVALPGVVQQVDQQNPVEQNLASKNSVSTFEKMQRALRPTGIGRR